MYAYADIDSVVIESSSLSLADGQSLIRLSLNGVFPGIEFNPPRDYTAEYIMEIHYPSAAIGNLIIQVTPDIPEQKPQALCWYDGPYEPNTYEAVILDCNLWGEPNDVDEIITNQVLELLVSNDTFFEPGSEPFEAPPAVSVYSSVDDTGIIITDIAEEDTNSQFDLEYSLPAQSPKLYIIGPGKSENGKGIGITGENLNPYQQFEVSLDGNSVGTGIADEFGQFLFYAEPNLPLTSYESHELQLTADEEYFDVIDRTVITNDFTYMPNGVVEGDLDLDGDVDFGDIAVLANNWLEGK
jgi:hypothetical protein